MDAPLRAYLEIAQHYYTEDKLDAAMAVVRDAFEHAGWPAGAWTAFYNKLVCEYDARNASAVHTVDETLAIELERTTPENVLGILQAAALEGREQVRRILEVELRRRAMVTVFLADAAVDFIVGSYGYVAHKVDLDKICIPRAEVWSYPMAASVLLHEFAHVGVFELAGDRVPIWMNEGLATHIEGRLPASDHSSVKAAARQYGRLPSVGGLEGTLGSSDLRKDEPGRVHAAYTLAASLVAWWVEHCGLPSVRDALVRIGAGESPERAFRHAAHVTVGEMERDWRRGLA